MKNKFYILLIIVTPLFLTSCGSGRKDNFYTPANALLTLSPSMIDSGDTTKVKIKIYDIKIKDIVVKVRFPSSLSYIRDSSYILIDNKVKDAGPTTISEETESEYSYLIYYFSKSAFSKNGEGYLSFSLEAISNSSKKDVEVDIDTNNPEIEDSKEFDPKTPKFTPQSSANIQVGPQKLEGGYFFSPKHSFQPLQKHV